MLLCIVLNFRRRVATSQHPPLAPSRWALLPYSLRTVSGCSANTAPTLTFTSAATSSLQFSLESLQLLVLKCLSPRLGLLGSLGYLYSLTDLLLLRFNYRWPFSLEVTGQYLTISHNALVAFSLTPVPCFCFLRLPPVYPNTARHIFSPFIIHRIIGL